MYVCGHPQHLTVYAVRLQNAIGRACEWPNGIGVSFCAVELNGTLLLAPIVQEYAGWTAMVGYDVPPRNLPVAKRKDTLNEGCSSVIGYKALLTCYVLR